MRQSLTSVNRRQVLAALAGAASVPMALQPAAGQIVTAELRGSIDGVNLGLRPGVADDQSRLLQEILDDASSQDRVVFLPAGTYLLSNINLPERTRIAGVRGATRLIYTGAGHLFASESAELVHLSNLVFDGANRPLGEYVPGTVHLTGVRDVLIEGCGFQGSARSALAVDRCGGRLSANDISGAAEAGVRALESTGLSITDNIVRDCGNNGILVHRWSRGEDGTQVLGNRVERIRADRGGTGPYGNGINVYQAHSVVVAQNRIADCAFSAIRSNSSDNVQIIGNNCARSGEMAIFSEFAFEGAVIANNIVDTAASGISVSNLNEGGRIAVVSGNVIRNLTGEAPYFDDEPGFGIGLWIEADAAVTGNVIDGAPRAAMWVGWGPFLQNVVIDGNVVRGAPLGLAISVVEGVGYASISDNLIEGTDIAISGWEWAQRATGDLAEAGSTVSDSLSLNGNLIVP